MVLTHCTADTALRTTMTWKSLTRMVDDDNIVPQAVAEADFVRSHPAYATTRVIDALRASEYDRLDNGGSTYLDYTGAGVYATSQVNAHLDLLSRIVAGTRTRAAWHRRRLRP